MTPHDPRHQCLVRLGGRARDRWGSLLAAALVAAFLWTVFGAASPVHADSRTVEQFLGQYLSGCVRQSRARGHDRLQGHAWCVCAVAQLRMEGSEAALEELARHVARGESIDRLEIFRRATRNRGRCDALGTHDAGPPDRLERSRNFGPFTIALPPGFLLLDRNTAPARASYGFHRLHGDLRSAATLQVVIRRASEDGRDPETATRTSSGSAACSTSWPAPARTSESSRPVKWRRETSVSGMPAGRRRRQATRRSARYTPAVRATPSC